MVRGDPTRPGDWQEEAARAQTVINLAGASIFRRWTPKVKEQLIDSRVLTTRHVVQAMASRPEPSRTLLSTSAVGRYGFTGDEELDESSPAGDDFLARLTVDWEAEALEAEKYGIRTVLMRFGIVLAGDGGALKQMLPLFKYGLGGRLGHGRQWFSWIHRLDLLRAAEFLLNQSQAKGPFNLTAPVPVTNAELTRTLGRALRRPAFLPAPGFMIRLVLGEFGEVLLEGQKVLPKKLMDLGFNFQFPSIDEALKNLLG
jgi:uncharacterized protein (TIGR01777 family)